MAADVHLARRVLDSAHWKPAGGERLGPDHLDRFWRVVAAGERRYLAQESGPAVRTGPPRYDDVVPDLGDIGTQARVRKINRDHYGPASFRYLPAPGPSWWFRGELFEEEIDAELAAFFAIGGSGV